MNEQVNEKKQMPCCDVQIKIFSIQSIERTEPTEQTLGFKNGFL